MPSLYERTMELVDRLDAAAALLRKMANGSADAARKLQTYCRAVPYEGEQLVFDVDRIIRDVLSDEDTTEVVTHCQECGKQLQAGNCPERASHATLDD